MTPPPDAAKPAPGLPLVVQLGFVGSRRLFDRAAHPEVDPVQFEAGLQPILAARLRRLPAELGLHPGRHFVCALSSLAIGADTLFSRACAALGWPHRVLLPQHREDFLHARGSDGTPDFSAAEAAAARELLAGPHVIQERVIGESPDRHERFDDVNLELIRACDLLVVLVRVRAHGQRGGSLDALGHAIASDRPVLELRVSVDASGNPQLDEGRWHHRPAFTAPALPLELAGLRTDLTGLPRVEKYCQALKDFSSPTSRERQKLFKRAALWVVGAHVAATLCAVTALVLDGSGLVPVVLVIELALLAGGLLLHEALHGGPLVRALHRLPGLSRLKGLAHAVRVWAMARLVSQIASSTLALRDVPAPLGHLFTLPLPAALRPLLRTLNVLHLRDTRTLPTGDWAPRREAYLQGRIFRRQKEKDPGQIRYYLRELRTARRQYGSARAAFLVGSAGAFAATATKLLFHPPGAGAALLGGAAVLLPVLAVAAMSLAAAYDLEARVHTYREMLQFLRAQRRRLRRAPTGHAFLHLALETEARLLGETAAWHARRAFTGIA